MWDATEDGTNSHWESNDDGGFTETDFDYGNLEHYETNMDDQEYNDWLAGGGWEDQKDHSQDDMKDPHNQTNDHYVDNIRYNDDDDDDTHIYDGLLDTHNYDNDTNPYDDDQYPPGDTPNNEDTGTPESPTQEPPVKKAWYLDNDGDGYFASYVFAFYKPSGNYIASGQGWDCDDNDPSKKLGPDCGWKKWYLDADGDGYHSDETESLDPPGLNEGWVLKTRGVDCEESDPTITTQCWPVTPSTCKGCGTTEQPLDDADSVYFDSTTAVTPYNFEAGKNHIFDANGRPLRSGAPGDLLQIEIDGVLRSPSELRRTQGTLAALNKIATFYAQSKGYSGLVKMVNNIGKKQGNDVAFYGNGVLTVRAIAFTEGKFNNVSDFKSTINHEVFHWQDPRNSATNYQFKDHANIYLLAASDPDFKNSSLSYKISQANEYINRILNASAAYEAGMNNTGIMNAITKYNNENTGGIKITNPFYSGSFDGFTFNISINGTAYESGFSYKKLESSRD